MTLAWWKQRGWEGLEFGVDIVEGCRGWVWCAYACHGRVGLLGAVMRLDSVMGPFRKLVENVEMKPTEYWLIGL